jgi:hypothetical protein
LLRLPVSERIPTRAAAEWLRQHAIQPKLPRLAELLDPDRHGFVTGRRLSLVGAE